MNPLYSLLSHAHSAEAKAQHTAKLGSQAASLTNVITSCHVLLTFCLQGNGFVDPKTGQLRTIPFEVMVRGDKVPVYEETLEDLGRWERGPGLRIML